MTSDREKLIELIFASGCVSGFAGSLADYLINHGVTFAKDTDVHSKWISVEDRLPENGVWVMVYQSCGWMGVAQIEEDGWYWYTQDLVKLEDPICWMSLPQPPREE